MHKLELDSSKVHKPKAVLFILIIIFGGIISGFALTRLRLQSGSTPMGERQGDANLPKVVGIDDAKTFPDSTEGQLEAGGINGEGTHKLIRTGGDSQTVYLTSSVLELNLFVGRNVRVWGQTFAAQKAGWLMDVGKVEVLN